MAPSRADQGEAVFGLMQDRPLLVSALIAHAETCHARTPVWSRGTGGLHRTDWGAVAERARRLANALRRLGVGSGDRIATLAWNTHRHLELYYAITGLGAVCHTINPRLFADQIRYIGRHAGDTVLFFEPEFAALAAMLKESVPELHTAIVLSDAPDGDARAYERLLDEAPLESWPVFDERQAAALCYTSGTTGDPKGVLYSHRSCLLHAYSAVAPDCFDISARSVLLPGCSMYHANAWGVPHAAALAGAALALPGARMDPASLLDLIATAEVTHGMGVPTVWLGVLQHLHAHAIGVGPLKRLFIGGSAVPPAMAAAYQARSVEVRQLWGMTEMSPLGVVAAPLRGDAPEGHALDAFRLKQGRPLFGVELKLVDAQGADLPRDGVTSGDLMARGWWVLERYFGQDASALVDGWLPTGDVATLDGDMFLRITDRAKDVIKSGGEWISSIDLENEAVAHPSIAEAAVIGVPHPKWDERPLLILRLLDGAAVTKQEMLDFLRGRVAKWWLPDDIILVEEIPHTATGKIQKSALRARFAAHLAG